MSTTLRLGDVVEVQPTRDRVCGRNGCQLAVDHVDTNHPEVHADISLSGVVVDIWPVLPDDDDEELL